MASLRRRMASRLWTAAGVGLRRSAPAGDTTARSTFPGYPIGGPRVPAARAACYPGEMTSLDHAQVAGELSALLGADAVVTEPHERARYEQGWRYGRGTALAVVRPGSTEEVSRTMAFAAARGLRVVPQGANTGLVGASTPDGSGEMLVLSLERMSRTLEIDVVDRTVVAGGGVLLSQLDAALAEKGLMFAIDLGADPTVGGMVATNAAGTRVLRYGDMRQNVLGIEVVLADGTVLDLMAP